MADSALSRDPLERYGAIEQAYCDDRWGAVIQDGQSLLTDLGHADPPPVEGLKERLQLLMAHAYLYGFGERDSAEDLYLAVLHSGAEATLRQIAEEGLHYCNLPAVAPTPPAGDPTPAIAADPPLEGAAASFWQEHSTPVASDPPERATGVLGEPPAGRAVTESPTQPDAGASAGGASGGGAPQAPLPQEHGILSWLNAGPATAPGTPASGPVMPWLEEQPSEEAPPLAPPVDGTAAAVWPSPPRAEDAGSHEQTGLNPGESGDDAVSRGSDPGVAWLPDTMSQDSAPAQASPLAIDETRTLVPGAAEADGSVASRLSLAKDDWAGPPAARGASTSAAEPVPETLTQEAPAAVSERAFQDRRTSEPARFSEEPLIPEVVDEPELIEVHQADPLRAEELDIAIQEVGSADLPGEAQGSPASEIVMDDKPNDLLASVSPVSGPETPTEESPAGDGPPRRTRPRRSRRPGPFANPPQPVDEEEPEMLMGLLKVEMG